MTGARADDPVRIRFEEEEERSSEGRDLFLGFDLEAGMLDEVDDEVRELLGNEMWELLGNEVWELLGNEVWELLGIEMWELLEDEVRELLGRFCQARAALNPSGKPQLSFHIMLHTEEGCHGTTRTALRATRISSSCSLSRRTVRTIIQAVAASATLATSTRGNARSHTTQSQYS
jgi:hypothetical protein